jgi:hypothetical protein
MTEIPNSMSAKQYQHYIKTGQKTFDKKGKAKKGILDPSYKRLLETDKELQRKKDNTVMPHEIQREVSFEIFAKLVTLNEYIDAERSNRYKAANLKKKMTNICARACEGLITDPKRLYDLHITWNVTDNKIDPDNIFFAVKFINDGMAKTGIIKADGRRNIRHIAHEIYTKPEYKIIVKLIAVLK